MELGNYFIKTTKVIAQLWERAQEKEYNHKSLR